MITVKVGPPLQEILELAIQADTPIMFRGHTGVGKSESLREAARRLRLRYRELDLSIVEAPELTGMPVIDKRRNVTRYAPPALLPSSRRGILVLEELNRAPRYVQAPALQLCTARCLNQYKLPKGWRIAAAINPSAEGDYYVDDLDPALMARFMVVNIEPDVKLWLAWAEANGVHPAIRRYVRQTPKIFDPRSSNPRSWKYTSDALFQFERGKFRRNTLLAAVAGHVGDRLARAFLKTYGGKNRTDVPAGDVVVASYPKVRAWVRKMIKKCDDGVLESLCTGVQLYLQDPADEHRAMSSKRQTANLRKLVEDLPAEFRKKIVNQCPWIKRKRSR